MDDMSGLIAQNYGIRQQGKAAPMAASKTASTNRSTSSSSTWTSNAAPAYDDFFNAAASSATANSKSTVTQPHDPILDTFNKGPVFDTPVYDDDIFDGVPGVKSSSNMRFDDVFGSGPSDRSHVAPAPAYDDLLGSLSSGSGRVDRNHAASPPPYDDLLGGLGTGERKDGQNQGSAKTKGPDLSGFDDLLPGFGSSVPPSQPKREVPETELPKPPKPTVISQDDPFSVFGSVTSTPSVPSSGLFPDPLDQFTRSAAASESAKVDSSPTTDNFFPEDRNSFESGSSHNIREKSPDLGGSFREKVNLKTSTRDSSPMGSFHKKDTNERSPLDDFDVLKGQAGHRYVGSDSFPTKKRLVEDPSPESSENSDTGEDVWLTVSEIPLFTQPTSAPPPSRPPPPLTMKQKPRQSYSFNKDSSPVDETEFEYDEGEMERSSAAMKDAVNKAEAKLKHARVVREKMAKSKEAEQLEREEDERERGEREHEEREREEKERERERRRIEREEEEKRRKEREERDRARLAVERATREARERAANEAKLKAERAAVQRAQHEARERAAAESLERAEREARAAAESAKERERVEREAREKAAAERVEREKAERERAERQRREQRAAVEKAAAEARERLAKAAREKHQQQNQAQQRKPDPVQQRRPDPPQPQPQPQRAPEDDLESFFGSRATSAPRPARPPTPAESLFETQPQTRTPFDAPQRTASATGASIRKAASSVNMMEDLSAIFGGPSSSGDEFREIDGESEERRKARFEREQRTRERTAKALAEKNERDMQVQREQAEKNRISESLDFEIKRWAAGKEGNLRSLLSSLHYILWPECGWQPTSMADLITAAAVKKVYRRATLCVHPDKVQQKGATLQQKFIAEKVFDILKEAWNKFNSEELF